MHIRDFCVPAAKERYYLPLIKIITYNASVIMI